jgi:DNA mismatch endonuclease (patch repair protein)
MGKKKVDNRTEQEKRSYTMSRVRGKNTSIEVLLRKRLWALGIRYRKNYKKVPGCPDVAIVRYRIAVFCDGEFWHGKDWDVKRPKIQSNTEYWITKIERNIARDKLQNSQLKEMGWTVVRFWGNDIKKDLDGCVWTVLKTIQQVMEEDRAKKARLPYDYDMQKQRMLKVAEQVSETYQAKAGE